MPAETKPNFLEQKLPIIFGFIIKGNQVFIYTDKPILDNAMALASQADALAIIKRHEQAGQMSVSQVQELSMKARMLPLPETLPSRFSCLKDDKGKITLLGPSVFPFSRQRTHITFSSVADLTVYMQWLYGKGNEYMTYSEFDEIREEFTLFA